MNLESLRLLRNILLRSVVIGILFTLLTQFATIIGWNTWVSIVVRMFHADAAQFANLVLGFFVLIKFFLVFVLLTPALAIHWTLKSELAHTV